MKTMPEILLKQREFSFFNWCCLFVCLPLFTAASGQANTNISSEVQEWWTKNHLHLVVSFQGNMPSPNKDQAAYFLNFKNNWIVETEGLINQKLKANDLKMESITVGETAMNQQHHMTIHVVMKQANVGDTHKQCNIMAFIYTTTSADKNLKTACLKKLNDELTSFKKTWEVFRFFHGEVENKGSNKTHRTRWEGVLGVR